jgi:DeoR/GlpR family transcriptional regulator of sugar metabolism
MIAAAERTIFGLDNSKFGRRAQTLTSPFEARHTIVTDTKPEPSVARSIAASGAKVILAEPEAAVRA